MNHRINHLLSFSILVVFIGMALASATAKNIEISKEGGQIPKSFGVAKDTLLVIRNGLPGIGVGITIKKAFKDYKGPYLVIDEKELPGYDKTKYRFSFYLHHNPSEYRDYQGKRGPGNVSCVISDRLANETYFSTGVTNYGKAMKRYIAKLNEYIK